MKLKVTYGAPPNVNITITPSSGYAGPHFVDWGDGTRETLAAGDTDATHAYPGDGFWTVQASSGGNGSSRRSVILQNTPVAAVAGAHSREREKLTEEQFALGAMTTQLG